jgi:hypothetical protein
VDQRGSDRLNTRCDFDKLHADIVLAVKKFNGIGGNLSDADRLDRLVELFNNEAFFPEASCRSAAYDRSKKRFAEPYEIQDD